MDRKPTKGADAKANPDPHAEGPGTTGHSWDGIEEYNNPLPKWWLYTFYACIVWGLIYTILYPAWPMLTQATPGILGYSTRGEVAAAIEKAEAANADLDARLVAADLAAIPSDPELARYAAAGGAAVFRTVCAQCHGAGAAGVQAAGYPNLLDDDWLWGGTLADIHTTIAHGIRWEADSDTRFAAMPAFGDILTGEEIAAVTEHVLAISGQDHDAGQAAAGATLFADNCASCHGDAGMGNRDLGSPNLTDAIWLYGGTRERIAAQVAVARNGRMPAWQGRLSEAEIRQVAAYVHSLGGGE